MAIAESIQSIGLNIRTHACLSDYRRIDPIHRIEYTDSRVSTIIAESAQPVGFGHTDSRRKVEDTPNNIAAPTAQQQTLLQQHHHIYILEASQLSQCWDPTTLLVFQNYDLHPKLPSEIITIT